MPANKPTQVGSDYRGYLGYDGRLRLLCNRVKLSLSQPFLMVPYHIKFFL